MTNSSSSQSMRMPKRKYTVLSHTDMMEVAAKLSAGSQRNKKFGTAVSALMLQMLDICDGKIPSTISTNLDNNLDHHFERIVHNYKTSFKSVTDVSVQLVEEVELPPKAMHHERSTTKRLIPNVEKMKKCNYQSKKQKTTRITIPDAPNAKQKYTSCSFCKGIDHRISNCPMKDNYGTSWDGTELIKYLKTMSPYSILTALDKNRIITSDVTGGRNGIRHVVVHMMHSKISVIHNNGRPSEEEFVATVSFLDSYGQPLDGYKRCLLNFGRLTEYLYKNQQKGGRYIFSTVEKESVGPNFVNISKILSDQQSVLSQHRTCHIGIDHKVTNPATGPLIESSKHQQTQRNTGCPVRNSE